MMLRACDFDKSWPIVSLDKAVDFLDNLRKPIKASERTEGDFIYYGANGPQGTIDDYIFDEPLILLAEDGGHFGNPNRDIAYIANGKYWVNNHAHVLKPKDGVDINFLYRVLQRYDVTPYIKGATRAKLTKGDASKILIPVPSPEVQKRIAAILDKADAIRQKRQQAIALADDFLRSVFLDMFGDPVTNPLGWKTGSLIDFGDFKNGLNYTSSEVGEEVFCIGVGDFKSLDRIEGVSSLSKINLSSLPKNDYFVDEGDILFVRSNGNKELVGRNVIVYPEGSKVTFSGFCIRYRINDKDSLSNLYLSHCLKIPSMRKLLLSGGQGANIQNISQKTLSELIIPIPSIDMQNTYNEIVNGHQRLIKKSNYDFLKSYELFNSISKKAFSGQL
ncbi:restriction endonuclease subunit S [Aeromonas sp. R2-4]|uniref:restriction endonuclease subunit S n=1 Tax=Aeromonas sp. R2-4 TaxID=3138462 RepID=UPI0034A529CA